MPGAGDAAFLERLRALGAIRLKRLTFRRNRSTIWSVTQGGHTMNLHVGYRSAPVGVVRALAVIARDAGSGSPAFHRASQTAKSWPGIDEALAVARQTPAPTRPRRRFRPIRCAGTPSQQHYLRRLYTHLNETRFYGELPCEIWLRLSNRMTTRLGQMVATGWGPDRRVLEIALNIDLLLEPNDHLRLDTLLHEMAHVAAFQSSGDRGHGLGWKGWALDVGCAPTRLSDAHFVRRPRGSIVTRVPPLPSDAVQRELYPAELAAAW